MNSTFLFLMSLYLLLLHTDHFHSQLIYTLNTNVGECQLRTS